MPKQPTHALLQLALEVFVIIRRSPLVLLAVFAPLVGFALGVSSCGRSDAQKPASDVEDFSYGSSFLGRYEGMAAGTFALTFDDGPSSNATPAIAEFLASRGIPATFFVQGSAAAGKASILRRLQELGHLVANHTYSHPDLSGSGYDAFSAEIRNTDRIIAPYVSGGAFLFRAPYGNWVNRSHVDRINATGMAKYAGPFYWNIGGDATVNASGGQADWACWRRGVGISTCADRYVREMKAKGRGVVLLHDGGANGWRTADMVRIVVDRMTRESPSARFVRLDEVPSVASAVRAAGGTPGVGLRRAVTLGPIQCPEGYEELAVGTAGGKLCTNGTDAWGPFSTSMIAKCIAWGGGEVACKSNRWALDLAIGARGEGACPRGATWDPVTTYCVEGIDAFGPFPSAIVEKCRAADGGQACVSARYDRDLLARLLRQ
jgi:peptidoglycan/xylan/chitin deacetylase (PgdA/CDA1 family)